jgi:hypothetical protein
MNCVLMTQRGIVQIGLAALAIIAERLCRCQGGFLSWAVSLDLRCEVVQPIHIAALAIHGGTAHKELAEHALDPVVHSEVDGPRREVAEDVGAKATIETADAMGAANGFDGVW